MKRGARKGEMRPRVSILIAAAVIITSSLAPAATAADGGCMKFSFDTLPFLGDSGKEREDEQRPVEEDDRPASERYTYDATGRKVPVGTE